MFPLTHMLKSFVQVGSLTVTDADGKEHKISGKPGPHAAMQLKDPTLYRKLFFNPELHAGEAYMDGRMTFEGSSLRDFLTLFSVNRLSLGSYPLQKVLRRISISFRRLQQANPVGQAQKNVAHHYDLGNEFYKLFLDDNMHYSCGYFIEDTDSLEQAQINKCRLLAAKLELKPGQRILDIGCGWGGLARYLATIADVEIIGVTLSREQHQLAEVRAEEAGLSGKIKYELRDYRDINEKFDRIVSVGMFEHVGVHHYNEFFLKINQLLDEDGIAVLHSIGHMSPPGTASPWLRKYIFPGAYSPALSEVFSAAEQNSLWVTDLEFLRVHYAKTLYHWMQRFENNRSKVEQLYDQKFCRMWEFYLISCEMMFRTGSQLVFHMQLAHKRDTVPIVRDYVVDQQKIYMDLEKSKISENASQIEESG